jgi:GTP cyclohydrolase I
MNESMIKSATQCVLKEIEPDTWKREGLLETPNRVARMYAEMYSGYREDPYEIMKKQFENEHFNPDDPYSSGMVIVKDIEFFSHCEHHMVPFFGKCSIGYIPSKKVVGISKLGRIVNVFAHRLQIQERLTNEIADCIDESLKPLGVMVVINATHLCMKMRGLKNATASTTTSAIRGAFKQQATREEFMSLLRLGNEGNSN